MMDPLLAYGVPALAAIVAATAFFSVRHSASELAEKIADERAKKTSSGVATAHAAPVAAYGDVIVTVRATQEPVDAY